MGQYFKVINFDKKQYLDPSSFMKLMEWSYNANDLILNLEKKLATEWKGDRVYVVGDYALSSDREGCYDYELLKQLELENGIYGRFEEYDGHEYPKTLYSSLEELGYKKIPLENVNEKEYRYIYNHKRQEYIDLEHCPVAWISPYNYTFAVAKISPLSLSLALGNEMGGGDFYTKEKVGLVGQYIHDIQDIEITSTKLSNNYREVRPEFYEGRHIPYEETEREINNIKKGIVVDFFRKIMKQYELEVSIIENEEKEEVFKIKDLQAGNLGNIESEEFKNLAEIIERLDAYHNDYIYSQFEEGEPTEWDKTAKKFLENEYVAEVLSLTDPKLYAEYRKGYYDLEIINTVLDKETIQEFNNSYILRDSLRILEFHSNEDGIDFTLYDKYGNEIDGGLMTDKTFSEKGLLRELEGFLVNTRPFINLSEENLIAIPNYKFEELIQNGGEGLEESILADRIVSWYDPYELKDTYDTIEEAFKETEGTLTNNPLQVYNTIRETFVEMNETDPEYKETKYLLNDVGKYVAQKEIMQYLKDNFIVQELDSIIGVDETAHINTLYSETLERMGVDNIMFIDTQPFTDSEGYNTEITFKSGGKFIANIESITDIEDVSIAILEAKTIADYERDVQEIIKNSVREETLESDEKEMLFGTFKKYIQKLDITELPNNATELKSNFLRHFYSQTLNKEGSHELNFKAMNNEIDNFYNENSLNKDFIKLSDLTEVQECLDEKQIVEEIEISAEE